MKIGTLRAIAHNIADSLGSGVGMLIGIYGMNVFGEAKKSPGGAICVDFLMGKATRGKVSPSLATAISRYRFALPTLCAKHGASIEDFKALTALYSSDTFNRRIVVKVRDRVGRCYVDEYIGTPARHVKVTDSLGRVRTKRGGVLRLRLVAPRSTSFAVELETKRLSLVPCRDEHLTGLSAMNSDPEVMRYISGQPQTLTETQTMIERVKARWAIWGYSWWTFIERRSGEIVGAGCIQNLRRDGTEPDPNCPLEIGWRVRRDRWGQGIATEAARAMADFAFARLHAATLYAVCDPGNGASSAVMLKLGMHYRGLEDWYARQLATYEITARAWRTARANMV
jgi:RimJ/RimL family protein N-acetyltransferase